jgi:UDP-N-acetyl-D-mannosaminuronic acid dehydrogenase
MMNISKEDLDSFEKRRKYTVSVIECGRIGVPHACLFADAGFRVIGVNTNLHTLEMLERGQTPFLRDAYPGLEKHVKEGSFSASSDIRKATSESDILVITVQTVIDQKRKPDYTLLEKTCKEVGMGLKKGSLIIFASPTGPGIVEGSMREVLEKSSGLQIGVDFGLAYVALQLNSQGNNSCVIVGAIDGPSLKTAGLVLRSLTNSEVVEISNIKTVEALVLFQNVNSEINQALSNELAFLCERLKIDFLEVLKVINKGNISPLPLPGMMDTSRRNLYMLQEEAENVNFNLHLASLASKINDEVVESAFHLVKNALKTCGKTVRGSKISIFGISKSPNMREPPATLTKNIVALLKKKVRVVQVYDPYFSKKEMAELGFETEKLSKVVEKTDCVLILTGHSKFGKLNLKKVKLLAKKSPAIVDIGHVIDPLKAERHGFVYRGLGRGVWTK